MNERMIQNALFGFRESHPIRVPNIQMPWGESDLLSVNRNNLLCDHEIKISKQDFRADFGGRPGKFGSPTKWLKHKALKDALSWSKADQPLPNYFLYVAPAGLLTAHDMPSYAGLLVWHPRSSDWGNYASFGYIELVKKPPRLHKREVDLETMHHIARSMMLRYWTQRQQDDPRCPGAAQEVA